MTGAASGAGTVYPSGAPEFIPGFLWDSCYSNFSFICMFCRSLLVLLYFFFWPLCCLFFFDIQILITSLWYLLAIVLSVLLRYTDSDYPFGIFWPLCCLFFFDIQILITSFWYLLAIVLLIILYFFFWPLCSLFFFNIQILITSLWYLQTLLAIIITVCYSKWNNNSGIYTV